VAWLEEPLAQRPGVEKSVDVDPRDEQMLFEVLFEIRNDVQELLRLLKEDEDEEEDDA
jgi:hypothetical protein